MEYIDIFWLAIIGAIAGFLAGLLGIGGGPVYAVSFPYFIEKWYIGTITNDEMTHVLIANAVFCRILPSAVGCYKHWRTKNYYAVPTNAISITSAIVALTVTWLLSKVHYPKPVFAMMLLVLLMPVTYKMLIDNPNKKRFNQPNRVKLFYLHAVGILNGLATALAGLGGGFVVIPLLNSFFNIKIRKVISISLGSILWVSIVLSIYNLLIPKNASMPYTVGNINFLLSSIVSIFGILPSGWGVSVGKKMSTHTLRLVFVGVVVALAAYYMYIIVAWLFFLG